MTGPERREETMRRLYALFNAREIEAVLEFLHSEVDWPNAIEGTRIQGLDQVWDHWASQFDRFQPHVEPLEFTPLPEGRLRIRVRQSVHGLDGELVDECELFHDYAFRHDRIVRMDVVQP